METEKVNEAAAALVAALAANNQNTIDAEAVKRIAAEVCGAQVKAAAGVLVGKIKEAAAAAVAAGGVRRVEVAANDTRPAVDLGLQHCNFEKLWKMCQAKMPNGDHLNIYLYGPAGTGKTTAAEAVARGIYGEEQAKNKDGSPMVDDKGQPVPVWRTWFHANGAINAAYDLLGFVDAGGRYHESEFFKAYSRGGVYLFDELDSSSPAAVLAFNQALANGCCAFPCGMVQRSPDCVIIAGGNTCMRGDGAGAGFQRVRHDTAFRDRFVFLDWPIDEKLEAAVAGGYGDAGRDWCGKVQAMRKNAAAVGVRDFEITPRASIFGNALQTVGLEDADIIAACVRKGLNDEAWAKVARGVL